MYTMYTMYTATLHCTTQVRRYHIDGQLHGRPHLVCHHITPQVHDRMTEQVYSESLTSFAVDTLPTPVYTVPVMQLGRQALIQINEVGWQCMVLRCVARTFRSSSPVASRLGCCQKMCYSSTCIVAGPLAPIGGA